MTSPATRSRVTEVSPGVFEVDPNLPQIGPDPRHAQVKISQGVIRRFNPEKGMRGLWESLGKQITVHPNDQGLMSNPSPVPLETAQKLFDEITQQIRCSSLKRTEGRDEKFWGFLELKFPLDADLEGPTHAIQTILSKMNLTYFPPSRL